jgi:nanoRNase/pAp phosphatase (c-di-AMP/oligoRNAs hydrolase)
MNVNKHKRDREKPKFRPKSARERVNSFLGLFKYDDYVLILINPDPDSIASALAVKRLLWKRVTKVEIAYINEIQRLENRTMVELLKIPIVQVKKISPEKFTRTILVDSQPHHSEIFEDFVYDAIIDHHPLVNKLEAPYIDVRPRYGATATILTEYLRAAKIKPSKRLATALLYAIKTDTSNFERDAREEDVTQFRYIFKYANINLLRKIENSGLRPRDLNYFQSALENRLFRKKILYTHVGEVHSPDICVQIADFFMGVYSVGWSIVSGIYKDTLIIIIRNDGYRKDAGKLAIGAFSGFGSAGGHRGAARAEIPLETLGQKGIDTGNSALEGFIRRRLKF